MIIAAGLLRSATSANHLLPTYEYTAQSMRGGSELETVADGKTRTGLEFDYATRWSYSKMESFNMLIPDFTGELPLVRWIRIHIPIKP